MNPFEFYPEVANIVSCSYQIYSCFEQHTKTRIVIGKEGVRGRILSDMLAEKKPVKDVEDFLLNIVLEAMDADDLRNLVKETQVIAFTKGYLEHKDKVKKFLSPIID